jgi:hypothetical protein
MPRRIWHKPIGVAMTDHGEWKRPEEWNRRRRIKDEVSLLVPTEVRDRKLLPSDVWQRMDRAERVEYLTGSSLDNCKDILDLPLEAAIRSPTVMNGKVQVIRALLGTLTKIGLESRRLEAMQQEALSQLIDDFAAEEDGDAPRRPPHRAG